MAMVNSIEQRVHRVVRRKRNVQIRNEDRFIQDLEFDSLDTVELTIYLEDEFKIKIPDIEAEKLLTVQTVIKYIEHSLIT